MLWRNNTINRNAHERFHSRETPNVDRKSHMPCGDMNVASLAAGSLDGDTKENFDDQQKIGETFPHLKSTKFSRP